MEITAVLEALRALLPDGPGEILVMSDSTYVVNCFRDRWWAGWQRRNWRNTAGKPVANRDLWEPLLTLALDPAHAVTFRWVKGHSGDANNDEVDRLAVAAATAGVGTTGPGG
jgi:ribonuclease HI